MTRILATLSLAAASVPLLVASPLVAPTSRSVLVTVFDAAGAPVRDLKAADFAVKENNKDYPVAKAELASAPIHLAVIVDDNGSGAFRPVVAALIGTVAGKIDLEVMTVIDRPQRMTQFGGEATEVKAGLATLGQRSPARDGSTVLDGVLLATKDLVAKNATRPAILVLTSNPTDKSGTRATEVFAALKSSRAQLHVLTLALPGQRSQTNEDAVNVSDAYDQGTKRSGGRRTELRSLGDLGPAVQRVLDQLTNQYVVSYELPDGVKLSDRFAVTVKRPGAVVMAPTAIPDK